MSFETVTELEKRLGEFFGAPYVVCLDACTHGIELCLRYQEIDTITVPKRTYISVPFLANKLNINLKWRDEEWKDFYSYVLKKICKLQIVLLPQIIFTY